MFMSFFRCIHSLKKYLFATYNAPGTVQGPGNKAMNHIDMIIALKSFIILWRRQERKQVNFNTELSNLIQGLRVRWEHRGWELQGIQP